MYHQISIKGLTILKNKSTYHYAPRVSSSYMTNIYRVDPQPWRPPGERSDPEGVKGVRVKWVRAPRYYTVPLCTLNHESIYQIRDILIP